MADGPRCKRRKQANPKRSSVTDFNNGLEASSDSDDEDKLHIVEEDSLQEPEVASADGTKTQDSHDAATATATATATTTVLPHNGSLNGVKEEYVSEEEEEAETDTLVDEILQQGDTAVIYPEAPEDEQSPAETGGADENGTPDSFSQLHTCPYCSRGYKRNASLKEHIKYRHETSEDNYSCSHCSYTFTYRSQLERHMSHHRGTREQRHVSQSTGGSGGTGGTRKFKCTECSKAFKYKHHLKEHLRIHSGEKPYECSNCKKRFSHSGSYSSHISSKKCVGAAPPNGVPRTSIKPPPPTTQTAPVVIAPARVILKEKTESKPLQEQLPVTQIKSEPVEYECKPVMAAPATSAGTNGVVNGGTAQPAVVPATTLPQGVAMVVPTVGLMSPISINLNDLQNVLKVAMDGNVLRQVLGTANGVVTQGKHGIVVQQPQQQIISLPAFVDHDGTTKIIINYSISPAAATTATTQPAPLFAKTISVPPPTFTTAAAPTPTKTDRPSTPEVTDLSIVKAEPESLAITDMETEAVKQTQMTSDAPTAQMPKVNSTSTCLLCDDCPDNLEALHLLQHYKAANGEAVDSAALDPSFAALLSEAGVMLEEPPVDNVLSLLKTYFASNANPSEVELTKISESVSIPVNVVRKWFAKMNSGKNVGKYRNKATAVCKKTENTNSSSEDFSNPNGEAEEESGSAPPSDSSPISFNTEDLVIVKSEPEDLVIVESEPEDLVIVESEQEDPVIVKGEPEDPVIVKSEPEDPVIVKSEPEDPVIVKSEPEGPVIVKSEPDDPVIDESKPDVPDSQAELLDLPFPKHIAAALETTSPPAKQQEQPLNPSCLRKEVRTINVTTPQTGRPVDIATAAQLRTLAAIAGQATVGCLSAIDTETNRPILIPQLTYVYATTASNATAAKTVVLNSHKERNHMTAQTARSNSPTQAPTAPTSAVRSVWVQNLLVASLEHQSNPPPPTTQTTSVVIATARMILKEKTESKPLQEQLPVTQIKPEPVEYECKPVMAAPATSAGTNGVVNGGTAQPAVVPTTTLPQGVAMVVPTVGLMSPISINLNDLQNVPKQVKRLGGRSDGVSTVEEQNEPDLAAVTKKRRLEKGTVYTCDLCPKVFMNKYIMLRHKYDHTGKRPHECNICKKAFKHKHHLIQHSRLHSGEERKDPEIITDFQCDLCSKYFLKKSTLLRHKIEHTGKRPYECNVCNKTFKRNYHLIQHLTLHFGEEPKDPVAAALKKKRRLQNFTELRCDICSKYFLNKFNLLRHNFEHTGKRPYECNICNKAFKRKHHLVQHSSMHSGEKPYQCDKCGKRFTTSRTHSDHVKKQFPYCTKLSLNSGLGPRRVQSELSGLRNVLQSDSQIMTPALTTGDRREEEKDKKIAEGEKLDKELFCDVMEI